MKLEELSTLKLLQLHSEITDKLVETTVIRSANNPVADYAEFIASKGLELKLEPLSQTGYDAKDTVGCKYEIKGRKRSNKNLGQFSVFRGLDEEKFDYFVGILFDRKFEVEKAWKVPHKIVLEIAKFNNHVNGWRLTVNQLILERPDVEDITELIRNTQKVT